MNFKCFKIIYKMKYQKIYHLKEEKKNIENLKLVFGLAENKCDLFEEEQVS